MVCVKSLPELLGTVDVVDFEVGHFILLHFNFCFSKREVLVRHICTAES